MWVQASIFTSGLRSRRVQRGDVEVHAIVVDEPVIACVPDRDDGDGDAVAVEPVVGDPGLDDGVVLDIPLVDDLVAESRDRRVEFGDSVADRPWPDQRLAVGEAEAAVVGEELGEGRRVSPVDPAKDALGQFAWHDTASGGWSWAP